MTDPLVLKTLVSRLGHLWILIQNPLKSTRIMKWTSDWINVTWLFLLHYPDVENHYSLKEVLKGTKWSVLQVFRKIMEILVGVNKYKSDSPPNLCFLMRMLFSMSNRMRMFYSIIQRIVIFYHFRWCLHGQFGLLFISFPDSAPFIAHFTYMLIHFQTVFWSNSVTSLKENTWSQTMG